MSNYREMTKSFGCLLCIRHFVYLSYCLHSNSAKYYLIPLFSYFFQGLTVNKVQNLIQPLIYVAPKLLQVYMVEQDYLSSNLSSPTYWLCDPEQVNQPLCISVSSSIRWK